jgi:hypothetical protein
VASGGAVIVTNRLESQLHATKGITMGKNEKSGTRFRDRQTRLNRSPLLFLRSGPIVRSRGSKRLQLRHGRRRDVLQD